MWRGIPTHLASRTVISFPRSLLPIGGREGFILRMSAHFDFSKMPARRSVLEPNQSYLPDYEPNYTLFKYPNPRKGKTLVTAVHFSAEGGPRRGSESAVILTRTQDSKRKGLYRHFL